MLQDGTTLFDLKRLRKDLKDLVDFDAGESNVPVLAAIYEIIEKCYVNKSTNDLYQLASVGNFYGEKFRKKGTFYIILYNYHSHFVWLLLSCCGYIKIIMFLVVFFSKKNPLLSHTMSVCPSVCCLWK